MKLSVQNGSFCWKNDTPLWQNLSFQVSDGEILAVMGPNGSGKTTLLRCLLGLLPWQSGKAQLNGQPLAHGDAALWKHIGYVPQSRRPALSCTVAEMVLLGRSAHLGLFAQPGKKDEALARQAMERVGISALADRPCGQLSGGEYQLVLFARALTGQPELLVLDEPEASLDFKNQQRVLEILHRLCHQEGLAAVWITHSPQNALTLADRALLLQKGEPALFGDTRTVLTEQNLCRAFETPVHICPVTMENQKVYCVVPELPGTQTKSENKGGAAPWKKHELP